MSYFTTHSLNSAGEFNNSPLKGQLNQRLFTPKEVIPPRNDVLWRIESGVVRTFTWTEDGTYITLGYWGSGDVVGHCISKLNPYQIECLSSVEVSIIPPHLWHQDINALLSHIQQLEELLNIVHFQPVSQRLWQFLMWLSQKFGDSVEQGKLINLNITHQEMAEVLNTTRVTITRLLQQFEHEGKLFRHKRRIILTLSL